MGVWSVQLWGRAGAVRHAAPSREDASSLIRELRVVAEARACEAAALAQHARRLEDALGGAGWVSYC
jgi:hypothetical protein